MNHVNTPTHFAADNPTATTEEDMNMFMSEKRKVKSEKRIGFFPFGKWVAVAALAAGTLLGAMVPEAEAAWGDETSWKDGKAFTNWNADAWYNVTQGWDNHNPNYEGGRKLVFNNNSQLTTENDFDGTEGPKRWQLIFASGASSARTINGSTENTFHDNGGTKPKIENNSTANHTINFPIKLGYNPLEINPVSGNLTFGGTISLNGKYVDIYGNNTVIVNGVVSGAGGWTLKNDSRAPKLTFNGNNSFTGPVSVESSGTLTVGHDNGLGATGSGNGTTVESGGTLALTGGITVPEAISISGSGVSSGGALKNASGNNSVSGTVTIGADATRIHGDAGTLTLETVSAASGKNYVVQAADGATVRISSSMASRSSFSVPRRDR